MATYDESIRSITLDAHADLAVYTGVPGLAGSPQPNKGLQYRFVTISGAHQATICNHDSAYPIGVLQNKPQVEGAAATVAIRGISLVEAGDTITAGQAIVVAPGEKDGRAVPIGTTSAGAVVVGIAVGGAAVGQLVPVLLGRFGA
jgi:hypothetical protein